MVRWYDPRQLLRTGIKVVLASIFANFADRREYLGVLPKSKDNDYRQKKSEIWIDYVADLGDGWNSTYTIASLLAKSELKIHYDGREHLLPRADILIMGGDEVYPVASRDEYRNRVEGPYRCALPWLPDTQTPDLFAIPGNHDWYDGLTSFMRLFCQRRWIGAWQTKQTRSYFALRLPHRWWLFGVDIQLGTDIDKPQLDYFEQIANDVKEGDRIILCTAVPAWIYADYASRRNFENFAFLEKRLVQKHGATLYLSLAGDLHHYSRYQQSDGPKNNITSGGGGAFLHGTDNGLPEYIQERQGNDNHTLERQSVYPTPEGSRELVRDNLKFPKLNPCFSLLLGFVYLFNTWILESAGRQINASEGFWQIIGSQFFSGGDLNTLLLVLVQSPASTFMQVFIIISMIVLCEPNNNIEPQKRMIARVLIGGSHGLMHILLNILLAVCFFALNGLLIDSSIFWLNALVLSLEILVIGSVSAGLLVGIYFTFTNLHWGFHQEGAYSSIRVEDYKNFLRLHITQQGDLNIYPIGVDRVVKDWAYIPEANEGQPWFEPEGESLEGLARLIEKSPIRIKPEENRND